MSQVPALAPHLQKIVDAEYPRFSEAEMSRHLAAVETLINEAECDHLVFCGTNRVGSIVQYLTRWPVTAEAVGVFTPGKRDALFVQWINHAPQAAIIADQADVAWGGESSIEAALDALEKRGARKDRIAYIGPLGADQYLSTTQRFGVPKNLNKLYTQQLSHDCTGNPGGVTARDAPQELLRRKFPLRVITGHSGIFGECPHYAQEQTLIGYLAVLVALASENTHSRK